MASQRGISIHLAADAVPGAKSDLFQLTAEQLAPVLMTAESYGLGSETHELVRDVGGFTLTHLWWKPHFALPRHSHNSDCMYYVLSGDVIMGNRTLHAGDSFFVPADAPYQYSVGAEGAEVLEIRHDVDHTDMTCYGDPESYQKAAADRLEANRDAWSAADVSPTFAANRAR
jgi:mannose-6-phosphate isomerase-like protein (cupin superfamily)